MPLEKYVLVIGNSRSGTTIVGSILDSHPQMICGNETASSASFWRGSTLETITAEIEENSSRNAQLGRPSEGYQYAIGSAPKSQITVLADKIWNPAVLLLAGDRRLLSRLRTTMGVPISLIHCVRNPFDTISTMHRKSAATLRDRLRWYFMHCDAIQVIIERQEEPIFEIHNEDVVSHAEDTSRGLFDWLGYPSSAQHLSNIRARVSETYNASRHSVVWTDDLIREVECRASGFPFLSRYAFKT